MSAWRVMVSVMGLVWTHPGLTTAPVLRVRNCTGTMDRMT